MQGYKALVQNRVMNSPKVRYRNAMFGAFRQKLALHFAERARKMIKTNWMTRWTGADYKALLTNLEVRMGSVL